MSNNAICVRELSKRYLIGQRSPHLRVVELMRSLAGGGKSAGDRSGEEARQKNGDSRTEAHVWALKDVSFEVGQGEAVGIIGENGAGKSTLLKLLAKITRPTSGWVATKGRMRSLLEVGTGFHPELTGRENVFLSGTILGMRRAEIRNRFDEIVEFAGVAKFIDTPVKHYSSGMFLRLGFSVAVMLEPEILLLDEVIAVGDVPFQRRCLDKLAETMQNGCTILFVSHNLGAVADLCSRVVLLNEGQVAGIGTPHEMIAELVGAQGGSGRRQLPIRAGTGVEESRLLSVASLRDDGSCATAFLFGDEVTVRIGVRHRGGAKIHLAVIVRDGMGQRLLCLHSRDAKAALTMGDEESEFDVSFRNMLNSGCYYLTLWLWDEDLNRLDWVRDCLQLTSDASLLGKILCNTSIYQEAAWQLAERA